MNSTRAATPLNSGVGWLLSLSNGRKSLLTRRPMITVFTSRAGKTSSGRTDGTKSRISTEGKPHIREQSQAVSLVPLKTIPIAKWRSITFSGEGSLLGGNGV